MPHKFTLQDLLSKKVDILHLYGNDSRNLYEKARKAYALIDQEQHILATKHLRYLQKYEKQIKEMQRSEEHTPNPAPPIHNSQLFQLLNHSTCENCYRSNQHINSQNIAFETISRDRINNHARFRQSSIKPCINRSNVSVSSIQSYMLCHECTVHLTSLSYHEANNEKYSWPGFVWSILTNPEVHREYASTIWHFIPQQWRPWWIYSVKEKYPLLFENISIDFPSSVFRDKTAEINNFWNDIESYDLARLSHTCNKHLQPTILCPWGCTDFLHRCGKLPFDCVLQRFIRRCTLKLFQRNNNCRNLLPARDDYIRSSEEEYDWLLLNPEWRVQPCIAFFDGIPFVLSCRDHDYTNKDNQLYMIHAPRWEHNLPSKQSDQLCHAVVKPRTVRQMRASAYSTRFQMHEQQSSFKGIDTIDVTNVSDFSHSSELLWEAQARSMTNRTDMLPLLDQFVEEKKLSNFGATGLKSFAKQYSENINYNIFKYGGTYMPVEVAMQMHRDSHDRQITVTHVLGHNCCSVTQDVENEHHLGQNDVDRGINIEERIVKFNRIWPLYIYPCQTADTFGATFHCVPKFHGQQKHLMYPNIWMLSSMLLSIERLWTIVATIPQRSDNWHGHLLSFLTKQCLPFTRRKSGNDCFKYNSNATIFSQFRNGETLIDLLQNIDSVYAIDLHKATYNGEDRIAKYLDTVEKNEKVIIFAGVGLHDQFDHIYDYDDGSSYELRYIARSKLNVQNFAPVVYSRHGLNFSSWWLQDKHPDVKQIGHLPNLQCNQEYIFVYVKVDTVDMTSYRNQFLKLLGGQTHVQCSKHSIPLISSSGKKSNCIICNERKEYLCCSCQLCKIKICKQCFKSYDEESVHLIHHPDYHNNDGMMDDNSSSTTNSNEDASSYSSSIENDNESLIKPYADDNNDDGDYMLNGSDRNQTLNNSFDNFDMDDLLAMTDDPDIPYDDGNSETDSLEYGCDIPTTNSADELFKVEDITTFGGKYKNFSINGSCILNQCASALSRKKHEIRSSKKEQYMLQKFCATNKNTSVPLLWPESCMFPSIFWTMAPDNVSVLGAISAPLLSEDCYKNGFATMPQHIRSRLTNLSSTTSSDPRYISYCHDVMSNISANHQDTRAINNNGFTVANDNVGGFEVKGKHESPLIESSDSRQMAKNLCASQEYNEWQLFLTFTCNQKQHFGTKPLREWIDSNKWTMAFDNWNDMNEIQKDEMTTAFQQSSSIPLLRVWEEVSALFIRFLQKAPNSPFKKAAAIFARKEYQSDVGNLSHIHALLRVNLDEYNGNEQEFVQELIRGSVVEIVRSNEVDKFIKEGLIDHPDDVSIILHEGKMFLRHRCNDRCLVMNLDGSLRCRKMNNLHISKDNTRDTFIELPNKYTDACIDRLVKCGLATRTFNGFKSDFSFFHPTRHVPATVATDDHNISPVDSRCFICCRSMQNVQYLNYKGGGGCCKYCCKYITKFDLGNRVSIDVKSDGTFVRKKEYLFNTKVSSSFMAQHKDKEGKSRNATSPKGRIISINEMCHVMLKYPEVFTDLVFTIISTSPLEFRPKVKLSSFADNGLRMALDLPQWRTFTNNQLMVIEDFKSTNSGIDKITEFSLRPPELRDVFNMVGKYFRWFHIEKRCIKQSLANELIHTNLRCSAWINGFNQKVKVRKNAFHEIIPWCEEILRNAQDDIDDQAEARVEIANLFISLGQFFQSHNSISGDHNYDDCFFTFAKEHLVFEESINTHLPIPVYSFIKPTMATQFIHHILLSMGQFETEIDLIMQPSIKDALRYAKLIGASDNEEELESYSNKLLYTFITKQLCYYPNGQRLIDHWIVISAELFDSVILRDEIPISDMPIVQMCTLLANREEEVENFAKDIREQMIKACLKQIAYNVVICNVPSFEEIMNATLENPCEWNALECFSRYNGQSDDSFQEQKYAIKIICNSIDEITDIWKASKFTKNVIVRGFPGAGKTFCMCYCMLYALSKGLNCISTAIMSKRSIELGGIHWHKLLCIPTDPNLSIWRRAEIAIDRLQRKPKYLALLKSLHVYADDEKSQQSAEFTQCKDIILRQIRKTNTVNGGIFEIGTMDHTQLQPVQGRPFLTQPHIISCYNMVELEHSVRAHNDYNFQRLQYITRLPSNKLDDDTINEFKRLCEGFTFVSDWTDLNISPSTYRIYARQVPAKEATNNFMTSIRNQIPPQEQCERQSVDESKNRYSHNGWQTASDQISTLLNAKVKEPNVLTFFKGALFNFTYNAEGQYSQSQQALCYDLPSQDALDRFARINLLAFPIGLKDFDFDSTKTKEYYISLGFHQVQVEAKYGFTHSLPNDIQAKRRQYGIKPYFSGTIHSVMGDTFTSIATSVSATSSSFKLWEKGQLVVIVSRTKSQRNTIFVGDKQDTIEGLSLLLKKKDQWSEYQENVLELTTLKQDGSQPTSMMTQSAFPFRIVDFSLPQDNTGAVYMVVSTKNPNIVHIDTTFCLRTKLNYHNTGYSVHSNLPICDRPYALLAYICGFNRNKDLMHNIMELWSIKKQELEATSGHASPRDWAKCGNEVIQSINCSGMKLICLFKE